MQTTILAPLFASQEGLGDININTPATVAVTVTSIIDHVFVSLDSMVTLFYCSEPTSLLAAPVVTYIFTEKSTAPSVTFEPKANYIASHRDAGFLFTTLTNAIPLPTHRPVYRMK